MIDAELLERVARDRLAVVIEFEGRQAIVAPMMAFGRSAGGVWAEASPGATLDAGHVRLLLVVAALAAVAREQRREAARLEEPNEQLRAEINLDHNMVGTSRPMRTLFDRIARVARTDSTILLRGESGTGKELVARAAHRNSARADRPFIAINCAALPETLLEASCSATRRAPSPARSASRRARSSSPTAARSSSTRSASCRSAAGEAAARAAGAGVRARRRHAAGARGRPADRRDQPRSRAAARAGTFRQDLYYRLNVVALVLPPLRERREDIPLLAEYFVRKHAPRRGRRVDGVEPDALARLAHDWPGNVRELENVDRAGAGARRSDQITAEDLPAGLVRSPSSRQPASLNYHERSRGQSAT